MSFHTFHPFCSNKLTDTTAAISFLNLYVFINESWKNKLQTLGPYLYYVWIAINSWMLLELHIVPFAEHVVAVIICFRYGSPILNIKWHQTLNSTEPKLITADKHIVRVWDPNTVSSFLSILFKCFLHYYSWCDLTQSILGLIWI